MRLTIEERDKILNDNYDSWLKAVSSNDKKLKYKVQISTVKVHGQRCECSNKAVMSRLRKLYDLIGKS